MKLTNKLFAGLTAFSMLAMVLAPAANVSVHADNVEDANAYEWARDYGLTSMPTFGAFRFEDGITRQEAAKFLVAGAEALEIDLDSDQTCAGYADLDDANPTLTPYIQEGCELGIFKDQLNFNPFQALTREQAELTVARIWYGFDAVNDYAEDNNLVDFDAARELLMQDGIVTKDIPGQSAVVRGHLLLMLYRLADVDHDTNGDDNGPVLPGHAEVSLVKSAGTQLVPYDAVNVKIGTIKLTAGTNPTKVSAVDVALEGLYDTSSVTNTKIILRSSSVVSREGTVALSTKKANVRFAPALDLAAGESHNFDVYVSLDGKQNENYGFSIVGVNVANGTASGTPVRLGAINTSSANSNKYDLTIRNNYSTKAGDKNKTIAEVSFQPRDNTASLNSFVLDFDSQTSPSYNVDEVFTNAKAYVGNTEVGSVALSKNKIIANDLNITEERRKTARITIKADVIHAGVDIAGYKLSAKESDVIAIEAGATYGLRPNGTITPATHGKVEGYNIQFKRVAIKDKEVAPDMNDVVLYSASYKAATDTFIDDFTFAQDTSLTTAELDDLFEDSSYILDIAGQEYPLESSDIQQGSSVTKNGEAIFIPANTEVAVTLKADTAGADTIATASPNRVKFKLNLTKILDADEDNANVTISQVKGDQVTVKAGNATVKNSTIAAPSSKTIFSNEEFEIGRFSIDVRTEDLDLDSFTGVFAFTNALAPTTGAANLAELLDDDENAISLRVLGASDAINGVDVELDGDNIIFSNVNHSITKNTVVNFVIKASFGDVTDSDGTTFKLTDINDVKLLNGNEEVAGNNHPLTNAKEYRVGAEAPEVTLSRIAEDRFLITVTNVDDESDLTLTGIDARVRTLAADSDFDGDICLVHQGSSLGVCNTDVANTGSIGPVTTFTLSDAAELTSNGGSVSYELLIDSDYIEPEVLEGSILKLHYNGTSENYSIKKQTTINAE